MTQCRKKSCAECERPARTAGRRATLTGTKIVQQIAKVNSGQRKKPERQCVTPNKVNRPNAKPNATTKKDRVDELLRQTFLLTTRSGRTAPKQGNSGRSTRYSGRNSIHRAELGGNTEERIAGKAKAGPPASTRARRPIVASEPTVKQLISKINIDSLITKLVKGTHKF